MARITPKNLRILNLVVAVIQGLAGGAILRITNYNSRLPVYTSFPAPGVNDASSRDFYVPVYKEVLRIPVGIYAAIFLLLSALNHLTVALPGFNVIYNSCLARNANPFRWSEYAGEQESSAGEILAAFNTKGAPSARVFITR